jgi:porin
MELGNTDNSAEAIFMNRFIRLFLSISAFSVPQIVSMAEAEENNSAWFDCPTMTCDWFGNGQAMRDAGIGLRVEWAQFYQGMVKGDGNDDDWRYGGDLNALLNVDLSKFGFWDGFSVTAQAIYNYGQNVNGYGGTLALVNLGGAFPGDEGADRFDVTALSFTQAFNEHFSVSFGKFNLIEGTRATPLRGGGGVDTFWNLNLAAPITGLSPATIFGGMARINWDPLSLSLFVFDSRDATNRDVFDDPFSEGVNFMGAATYRTTIAGRTGFYSVRGVYSTEEGVDLSNIDQLLLPPETQDINTKQGSWYVGASFQQYLVQSAANPAVGWGVFGEVALSDGNPNILYWSAYLGLGGSSFISSRAEEDRFGIAYFYITPGDDLKDGLEGIMNLDAESGVEMFYRVGLTPWLDVTGDLQIIDPASGDFGDAVFAGVRTNVRF